MNEQKLQEKCGVLGMMSALDIEPHRIRHAWEPLQGRGNDAAGLVARLADGHLVTTKQATLIRDIFTTKTLHTLEHARTIVAHNRYATSEGLDAANIQPIVCTADQFSLVLAHNGNLPDQCVAALRAQLHQARAPGTSDSSVMTSLLIEKRLQYQSWTATFLHTLPLFQGAFSLVMMTEDGTLFAARDPWGIRPLALGKIRSGHVVASESVSLQAVGAEYERELRPGELLSISPNGDVKSLMFGVHANQEQRCVLEKYYFSQAQSFDGNNTMKNERIALGREVARRFMRKNIRQLNCVVPVLGSGQYVAQGVSEVTRLPLVFAIKKHQKAARSFIQNTQEKRQTAIFQKHILVPRDLAGLRVVLCDDSIVRGNSFGVLIKKIRALKERAPRAIHVIVGSPPVVDTCDLGVAIASKAELLTTKWPNLPLTQLEKKAAEYLDVDSVTFATQAIIEKALHKKTSHLCTHCFGGKHPIHETASPTFRVDTTDTLNTQQVLFLASGNGSNVKRLLENMVSGEILAKCWGVVCNNPDASVIQRTRSLGVETTVLDSTGKSHSSTDRDRYCQELVKLIERHPTGWPTAIVLAGWNLKLSEFFLTQAQQHHCVVIEVHPALLSGMGAKKVMTSQGIIPEIRGKEAICAVFQKDLVEAPVTGVSVLQLLPGNAAQVGEIIIKQEVRRREGESLEDLIERIHHTEHQIFTIGLQTTLLRQLEATTPESHSDAANSSP